MYINVLLQQLAISALGGSNLSSGFNVLPLFFSIPFLSAVDESVMADMSLGCSVSSDCIMITGSHAVCS